MLKYVIVTMILVQIGFLTTLLYCVPGIMHGMWKRRVMPIVQWSLYIGFAMTRAWPFLAAIGAMWAYVNVISIYFLHEAATLSELGRYTQAPKATMTTGPLQF